MNVDFGTYNKDFRLVENRAGSATRDCEVKQPCTVENPVFIIKSSDFNPQWNIATCSTFGRTYVINDTEILTGGRMAVSCSVDVLGTYADDILNSTGYIIRSGSEGTWNRYASDSSMPISQKSFCENIMFQGGEPFVTNLPGLTAGRQYILTIIG